MKYYLGIDLGGTNIAAGIVDENYAVIAQSSKKTDSERGADAVIQTMIDVANEAISNADLNKGNIEWIGVGAPGTVNKDTGIIEYSNNLKWYDVPLREKLAKEFPCPIFLENDANAAAYGEYMAGSAKSADISVMVTLGTGVGGGIIIHNSIYSGFNFAGGELGHTVIVYDGLQCTCGRKGCLEAYASASGLITATKKAMEEADILAECWKPYKNGELKITGRTAFELSKQGDHIAKAVVKSYIGYLACGIINIINTFQPDILSIGGGISHEGAPLLAPLTEIVNREVYSHNSSRNTYIVGASLGNAAGLIGAALLGMAK